MEVKKTCRPTTTLLLAFLLAVPLVNAYANDVEISNCVYMDANLQSRKTITSIVTVTWKNAWHNEKNNDAVWLFFKINNARETRSQRHVKIKPDSAKLVHDYLNAVTPGFWVPEDKMGIMVYPSTKYRGDVSWRIQLELDASGIETLNFNEAMFVSPYAIEMVYIPKGAFYAGSPDSLAQKNNASFFTYGNGSPYKITSEEAIEVGNTQGSLFYNNQNEAFYKGDAKGPVPAGFPKGFNAFYIMKYELSEGNYVDFLNSISEYFTANRAGFMGRAYGNERGSITLKNSKYQTTNPNNPATFLSFDDDCAFADWAGLRPMTELEFEKASRGTVNPVFNDYPWGTATRDKVSWYYDNFGNYILQNPCSEKDLTDSTLEIFGASYYWVMALNKSLWERCVTLGNEKGRQFRGTHGDGNLGGYFGNATNEDWPNSYDGKGGISYRGGGTYEFGMVGSPEGQVADRSFGAWGDGPRTIAYGFRAVRSAEKQ